jgi:hypothetical protein
MSLEATDRNQGGLGSSARLLLLAFFNSFVVDWLVRHRVTAHVSFFLVYGLPMPRLAVSTPQAMSVISRAARLTCTTPEFADLWQQVMGTPWSLTVGATDIVERARLRAELDGLVAHLYGLTDEEFTDVLSAFPVVREETKDSTLAAFRALAQKAADPDLAPLLFAGEGPRIEYKSTLRWDQRENKKNPVLESVFLKTVAGFLNAQGGTLLLGVGDDGSPVGLELDYQTLQKKDRDGYGLFLTDLLSKLRKDLAPCWHASFHRLDEHDVCRLEITPAHRPVFVTDGTDEVFWLRTGNSTRKLSGSELLAYEKVRWPPSGPTAPAPALPVTPSLASTMDHYSRARPSSPIEDAPLFRPKSQKTERLPDEDRTVDDIEPNEAMCAIRELFSAAESRSGLEREEALRALAGTFGFDRMGSRIREVFDGYLSSAARRGIVATEAGVLHLAKRSISDYERQELREQLVSAIASVWTPREDAIRLAARRLGFRRTGNKIHPALTSALRGALKMSKLESDGDLVRRARR